MARKKSKATLVERITRRAKNNPAIAGLILIGAALAFAAGLLSDLTSLGKLFRDEVKISGQYHINTHESAFAQVDPSTVSLHGSLENFKGEIFGQTPQYRRLIRGVRSHASRRPEVSPININSFQELFDPDLIVGQQSFDLALKMRPILVEIKKGYEQSGSRSDDLAVFFVQPANVVPIVGYVSEVLSFLEPLYTIGREPPLDADTLASLIRLTASVWPKDEDLPEGGDYRNANKIFRHAALRQVYPVMTLVIENSGGSSQVVTAIKVQVKEFYALADTYVSGPLELLGSVSVDLNGRPGDIVEAFGEPRKIAPKDAVQFKIRLTSDSKGAYLANVQLLNGESLVYSTADFVLVFDAG